MDICMQIHQLSPALPSMHRANYITNSTKNGIKATQFSGRLLPVETSIGTRKNSSRLKFSDISTRCSLSSKLEEKKELDSFFTTDSRPIMLFDGVCNLCNGGVKFIRDNDPKKNIRYVSLQSESGRKLLVRSGRSSDDISSVVLVEKDKSFIKSEAVLRIFSYLDLPYPQLATFLYLVPLLLSKAGGLERHALTLHRVLAKRGHQVHIFTGLPIDATAAITSDKSMHFHFTNYTDPVNRFINKEEAWSKFQNISRRVKGFDIIHTESVGLPHKYAKGLSNVVATWQGIAYESTHSSIVQELTREPADPRTPAVDRELKEHLEKVIQEIKFFQNYKHHVGTSDYMGDVLRRVYMLPAENVHIILNGVDEGRFRPDPAKGRAFRVAHDVPLDARLVLGMSGRLVKDKGHPMVFKALRDLFSEGENANIFVLIAGDGPWGSRYAELGPNVKVLGPLDPGELGDFYNALDVFMNPTLRAQGLDQTTLEAMLCGKAVFATHFGSITRSAIVSEEFGYTFSPTHESLKKGLERVFEDGKKVLEKKGRACGKRAALLFTAQKMAAAFERLFLCIAKRPEDNVDFCSYPLPTDTV